MTANLRFAKLEPHPILCDEEQTGEFARELRETAAQEQILPWCSYIAWLGDAPVAMGGFKGTPDRDNTVEIGYLTFGAHRGQGHATTLSAFLVQVAKEQRVQSVTAHTLMESNASTRVLEKNGFARDGFGHDDDVGEVWRWRLQVSPDDLRL